MSPALSASSSCPRSVVTLPFGAVSSMLVLPWAVVLTALLRRDATSLFRDDTIAPIRGESEASQLVKL
jgi:hypothetical protein